MNSQDMNKGGEFLIKESNPQFTFTPEEFSEEQLLFKQMVRDFLEAEIFPNTMKIENQEPGLMVSLLEKAGALGILGASLPEEYNGLGKDFITSTLLTEAVGEGGSFAVAMAAHTGIGTLPIYYFGSDELKKKYLPKLATGEWKAAYCLTEPGSGSDALAAKTTAVLSDDKKFYVLNGQKMWITNGGFADVFTVFAKVNGTDFTGFVVEAATAGLTRGEEEHKMGIKGSSTRQIFFQDCKVPVENVLGEIGKGHLIAFNILNIGRLKLAAAALGGMKLMTSTSVQYATQREQFKKTIASFGAIKYKLAEQAIKCFVLESALYRSAGDIKKAEESLRQEGKTHPEALMGAAEEYAVECAILKVYGSEFLDYVVDEAVQIYGGLGFSEEYAPARAYRDSRINRIFEGTNEINRLLTVDMLLKRAMKGKLDLMNPAMAIQKELMSIPETGNETDEHKFSKERKMLSDMKKTLLMTAGAAVQKLMMKLETEQEVLLNLANIISEIYLCESVLLRVTKKNDPEENSVYTDILTVYMNDAMERIAFNAKEAIAAFGEGDEKRMLLMGIKRFTKNDFINTKEGAEKDCEKNDCGK